MGENEGVFHYADLSTACWENENDVIIDTFHWITFDRASNYLEKNQLLEVPSNNRTGH